MSHLVEIDADTSNSGVEPPAEGKVARKPLAFVGKVIVGKRLCDRCAKPGHPIRETQSSNTKSAPCWRDLCPTCVKAVFGTAPLAAA